MPQIKSNFILKSKQPNFSRDSFDTLQDMCAVNPGHMDEGHISYCKETGKHYVFNSDSVKDENTGYFTVLLTSTNNENPSEVTGSLIIYNTLHAMRSDSAPLGQIVYCKETMSHYFYASEEVEYDETTGYFRKINDVDGRLETLEEIVDKLENNASIHEGNINDLTERVSSLEESYEANTSDIESLQTTTNDLTSSNKTLSENVSTISSRITELSKSNDLNKSNINILLADVEAIKSINDTQNSNIEAVSKRLEELISSTDKVDLTDIVEDLEKLNASSESHTQSISSIINKLTKQESTDISHSNSIEELRLELRNVTNTTGSQNELITAIRTKLNELDLTDASVKKDVQEIQDIISNVQDSNNSINDTVYCLKSKIDNLTDSVDSMESQMDSFTLDINRLKSRASALESSNATHSEEIEAIKKKLNNINTNPGTPSNPGTGSNPGIDYEELAEINSRLDKLESYNRANDIYKQTVNSQIADIYANLEDLEDSIGGNISNNAEITDIKNRLNTVESTNSQQDTELEALRVLIENMEGGGSGTPSESIINLINKVDKISNQIWPITIRIEGTSGTYRMGRVVEDAYFSWSAIQEDQPLEVDSVVINGETLSDLSSSRYTFEAIRSTTTNTISVTCKDVTKSDAKTLKFIYPKYYGWITTNPDDTIINSNNVMIFVTSGEIINDKVSQQINIPSNIGMGRWMYMYPAVIGDINSIVDGNGFNQMGGVEKQEITIVDPVTEEEVLYYVYTQTNSSDISNLIIKIN